jgi:hypothetical protein
MPGHAISTISGAAFSVAEAGWAMSTEAAIAG